MYCYARANLAFYLNFVTNATDTIGSKAPTVVGSVTQSTTNTYLSKACLVNGTTTTAAHLTYTFPAARTERDYMFDLFIVPTINATRYQMVFDTRIDGLSGPYMYTYGNTVYAGYPEGEISLGGLVASSRNHLRLVRKVTANPSGTGLVNRVMLGVNGVQTDTVTGDVACNWLKLRISSADYTLLATPISEFRYYAGHARPFVPGAGTYEFPDPLNAVTAKTSAPLVDLPRDYAELLGTGAAITGANLPIAFDPVARLKYMGAGTITGTVNILNSSYSALSCTVLLYSEDGILVDSVVTGTDGVYTFKGLSKDVRFFAMAIDPAGGKRNACSALKTPA